MSDLSNTELPSYLNFLKARYKIIDFVGDGAFSHVYSVEYKGKGTKHAIKVVNKTSAPSRIHEELMILKKLEGKNNVIPITKVIRNEDQVVIEFPLVDFIPFKDFILQSSLLDKKYYMYSLLRALKHVHDNGIIHRDIKPSNFLFDNTSKNGYLIDFGLAHYEKKKIKAAVSRPAPPVMFFNSIVSKSKAPGYYERDTRPLMKAPRAGTRGFRAPEVLFKHANQTTSIDIWSAGVIFLCLLTKQYPFFLSNDDVEGLVEFGVVFGSVDMRKTAKYYGKVWKTNINTIDEEGVPLEKLVKSLNPSNDIDSVSMDLLKKLLKLIGDERISAEDALKHPFFNDVNF